MCLTKMSRGNRLFQDINSILDSFTYVLLHTIMSSVSCKSSWYSHDILVAQMAKGHTRLLQYDVFRCSSESLARFISISDCELANKVRNISKKSNVVELCKMLLGNKAKFHVKLHFSPVFHLDLNFVLFLMAVSLCNMINVPSSSYIIILLSHCKLFFSSLLFNPLLNICWSCL